jgi:putative ABC transport system permease protein
MKINRWLTTLPLRLRSLFRRERVEQDLNEELQFHLDQKTQEYIASGLTPDEARRKARREFGCVELSKENCRDARRVSHIQDLLQDLGFGLRILRNSPGFAIVAILSLALGIGANTAIFELLDAVLLRTLPVAAPEQLAEIRLNHEGRIGSSVARQKEYSSAQWAQLEQQQQAFSAIAAWSTERFDLGKGGEARYAEGLWVSGDFFRVLQVNPVLGRLFSKSDDYRGCGVQGVVISDAFWQREFGGRANLIGNRLSLDGYPFQIIGVTPPSFYGLEVGRNFDVALPLCSEPAIQGEQGWTNDATTWWLAAIGRLKPGWTLERATAQLAAVTPGILATTLPSEYDSATRDKYLKFSFRLLPAATGVSSLQTQYQEPLFALLAISGLVLLIACANLANLMLARASAREKEMALRLTLGASRGRVLRQLLAESLLLAAIGAAIGMALAQGLSKFLVAFISNEGDPIFLPLWPDLRVLLFTMGLTVLTCLLFGVAPALQAAGSDPGAAMKGSGRGITTGRQSFVLRRGLIVSQVALSLVLLVAALLFVRTFRNLLALNAGLQQDNVLVADFDFSRLNLPIERRLEYRRQLLPSVRSTPGVDSAAQTSIVPLRGDGWNEFIDIPEAGIQRKLVDFDEVSAQYFQTLRIPLLAGRDFNENDTTNAPPVAIVNEKFSRTILGGGNAIGRTFRERQAGGKPDKVYQIVGLVGDTKYRDLRDDFNPIVFVAADQNRAPDPDSTIVIRSSGGVSPLVAGLKDTAQRMSPEIVLEFGVLRTSVLHGLMRERLMATLSGFYGALAAMLATVGLYGIISYMVIRRRNEIGIRMALGASKSSILKMILREGLGLVAVGLVIGTVLAIIGGKAARAMLFGVNPADPFTLAVAIGGMTLVAVAASLLPALRATGIHPMQVLREE